MESQNIAWDIVGDRYVSTAMIPRLLMYADGYVKTYETIIWEYKDGKVESFKHQIHHSSEESARKVHNYIVNNLNGRQRGYSGGEGNVRI